MIQSEKQLHIFENFESNQEISTQELVKFTSSSKSRSGDLGGAIQRLIKAKRYHEIANKLAKDLLLLRMENDKLKEEIDLLKKAN